MEIPFRRLRSAVILFRTRNRSSNGVLNFGVRCCEYPARLRLLRVRGSVRPVYVLERPVHYVTTKYFVRDCVGYSARFSTLTTRFYNVFYAYNYVLQLTYITIASRCMMLSPCRVVDRPVPLRVLSGRSVCLPPGHLFGSSLLWDAC